MHLRIDDAGECKENTPLHEKNDWLHRNDAYQRQPVCTPCERQQSLVVDTDPTDLYIELAGISKIYLSQGYTILRLNTYVLGGADITNFSEASQSNSNTPPTDPVERKRQRERDRYMQMSPRSKEELLKKRCEYRQQKKASLMPDDMEHLRTKDKARYTSMSANKRRAKVNHVSMLRALRRNIPSQASIAKENPLYTQIDMVFPLRESISVGPEVTVDFGSPQSIDTPDGKIFYALYNNLLQFLSYTPTRIFLNVSVTNHEIKIHKGDGRRIR